jgi:hypothetical protein
MQDFKFMNKLKCSILKTVHSSLNIMMELAFKNKFSQTLTFREFMLK